MEALGVNLPKLLYQLINFAIMAYILYRLLYKPVFTMLKARAERIEQSLKDADQVKEQLSNAKRDYDAEIAKARQEAAQILSQAQERLKNQEQEIVARANAEAGRIVAEARQKANQERDQLLVEAKDQIADLVRLAAERVLQAELAQSGHDRLIEESLSQLGSSRSN